MPAHPDDGIVPDIRNGGRDLLRAIIGDLYSPAKIEVVGVDIMRSYTLAIHPSDITLRNSWPTFSSCSGECLLLACSKVLVVDISILRTNPDNMVSEDVRSLLETVVC